MGRIGIPFRRDTPAEDAHRARADVLLLFAVSVFFFALLKILPTSVGQAERADMLAASRTMAEAMEALVECRSEQGLLLNEEVDPNRTGLVGVEMSSITTSRGSLEAKRSTTNPDFAAVMVLLLTQAGVAGGDTIALGASGSFPGLIVAVLSASKAMRLKALTISSLGASSWGANQPEFHWLRMEQCLRQRGVLDFTPVGVSLGGDRDVGEDMSPEARSLLAADIAASGEVWLNERDLPRNVEARMKLYESAAGGEPIKAFVNIGGAWANIGESSDVLKLEPGLVTLDRLPTVERRGVLHAMASRGIPVIHLLHIRGLTERYGLPWDPIPLPAPAQARNYELVTGKRQPAFVILAAAYFVTILVVGARRLLTRSLP